MLTYSREFIVLASCLNYAKAAKELNISQPSLSRHIADLEKELGFQLLERNPLALTAAGRGYVGSISDIIARLDTVIDEGRQVANRDSKFLSISMIPSENGAYSDIIYESIARMYSEFPDFVPRFYSSRSQTISEAVESGKADVGVIFEMPSELPDGVACELLVECPFIAWVHKDNPALKSQPVKFTDLADCKLVSSTNQLFRDWVDGAMAIFRDHGMNPKTHLKDLNDTANFLLDLRPDEVVLGSDKGKTTCDYNPYVVGLRFEDPVLYSSTYLLYRVKPEKAVVDMFVNTCHAVSKERW